jgi:hypothetical protein
MRHERRRPDQVRLPVRVAVSAGERGRGEAWDLSQGGLLVWLPGGLAPGSPVTVTLHLRRRPALTLTGTVVRTGPHPFLPGQAIGIQLREEVPLATVGEIADEEFPGWEEAAAAPAGPPGS